MREKDINEWPIIDPLPSYGRGRDSAGGRYSNLIMGYNLTDVVITGNNGTIDGQGETWWKMFRNKELNYTRGFLIELMYSIQVLISNITLVNSPSWNVHPVYSSQVIVSGITILAPVNSPNTDGINPDSSSNVRIEDCYIVSGDDCIAIKSGWDEYGIAFNMPSKHIVIRRLTCISPTSAVIALGSEMSGGIQDVRAEDITAINSESGVRIKTTVGRGAYVKDIFVRGMNLYTMKWVFWMTGTYGQHPDDNFDPKAIPVVQNISYSNVVAENVTMAAKLEGIPGAPFTGICIYNVTAEVVKSKKPIWNCTDVEGVSSHVTPTPCAQIPESPDRITHCPFPEDDLPVLMTLVLWTVVTTAFIGTAEGHRHYRRGGSETELEAFHYAAAGAGGCRAHVASLTDFGGVGDGVTSNTAAFAAAVANLSKVAYDGGAMLVVPAGRWLTGAFRLTRHFTLFLDHDAVILATQDINEWPIIDPLPSYGRGRDSAGGRYSNLIMGYNLTDVVITGNNGTIDGQGETWWKMFRNKELNYTRGFLIELMYSIQVLISNITLVNSPSWNVHPVYSSHVIVSGITILAPVNSPNTDGINPVCFRYIFMTMEHSPPIFHVLMTLVLWTVVTAAFIGTAEGHRHYRRGGSETELEAFHYAAAGAGGCRAHVASLTDFGGVGDGVTSNTAAFAAAVANLSKVAYDGGAMLVVPAGRWLTGPFSLTSHFTLFLDHDAVILATQDINEWPIIDPLPSYGRGRDSAGGRYSNLIMGYNLTDVVITGNNGTIDGQGETWWKMFRNKELSYTRGYLIEFMYCIQVLISNITLVNSPSWNVHPVYSSHVIVSGITILAPVNSPNTDGINPDSSSNVRIEDCYIVSGDDCIAIKSGWDEYGIAFNMPSKHIVIRRLTCISPTSAVIALGSEMSGGIQDVRAEDITAINSESGVRIKTTIGRGAYVKDIFVRGMNLHTMKWVFWMTGTYGQHPDDNFDPKAIPVVRNIIYSNVVAENVTMAAKLEGIPGAPFTGICIYNVTAEVVKSKKPIWNCTDVEGVSSHVTPTPCAQIPESPTHCPFPEDDLPVDCVGLEE
ncbi:Glycosyl hydrolases family 28, partial [Musa troglodytarum]